jgi:hypothetical protein
LAAIPPLSNGAGQAPGFRGQSPGALRETRAAAQRAFFQAALDRTQAPPPLSGRQDQPTQPPSSSTIQGAAPDTPPERPLRPGSLLNIVV